jgi:hypothetical protein
MLVNILPQRRHPLKAVSPWRAGSRGPNGGTGGREAIVSFALSAPLTVNQKDTFPNVNSIALHRPPCYTQPTLIIMRIEPGL